MFWNFEGNHGDPNEKESIIKKSFWIISLLSAAFEDHQTPSGWQVKEWNLSFHDIESNWIQFISLFHQPLQSQNFIHYPFTNHYCGALWGTPFANWFGAWNQQFLNKRFKKKKIIMFWDFGERFESKWKGINAQEKHLNLFNFRIITKESKEWSLANQFHFLTKSKPQG